MKTIFRSLVVLIGLSLFAISCSEKHDGYIITGKVNGPDGGIVKLAFNNVEDKCIDVVDSAIIKNGKYELKGKIEHPDQVYIEYGNMSKFLFLENCEITVDIDPNQKGNPLTVTGSKAHAIYVDYNKKRMAIYNEKKYAPIDLIYKKTAAVDRSTKEGVEEVNRLLTELQTKYIDLFNERSDRITELQISLIKKHPNSLVAPAIIGTSFTALSREKKEEIFALFKGDAIHTTYYKIFDDELNSPSAKFVPGAPMIDFTLNDLNGNPIKLSEVKGKYIMLDFWASWCGACRNSFKHLKEVYKEYEKDGFVVVCVTTGDTDKQWRIAIGQDETEMWVHLFDPKSNPKVRKSGVVSDQLGISKLPTNYLLDENLTILGKDLHGEKLDGIMKELFKH